METGARAVVEQYVDAVMHWDWDAAALLVAPDYVEDYPQSGERIEGRARLLEVTKSFPSGGIPPEQLTQRPVDILGAEDRWVMSPTFIPLRVEGSGDTFTTVTDATYPDGSRWFIISLVRVRNGLIVRARTFWAGDFEPAEWRAPFVRIVEDRTERVRP